MKRLTRTLGLAAVMSLVLASGAHALIGIGVHYGLDFSLRMDDVHMEQLVFDDLSLDVSGVDGTSVPSGFDATIPGDLLPIYVERVAFERTVIDFGGKILIDKLDWFDIELSTNIGVWEYDGRVVYPDSLAFSGTQPQNASDPRDLYDVHFDTLHFSCKDMDIPFWNIDNTPYSKLHFDLTIRKSFLQIPKRTKTLSLYVGGGASMHFATPVLSAQLIEDVLEDQIANVGSFADYSQLGPQFLGDKDIMTAVLEEIVAGMSEPTFGIHIVAGTQLKLPVVPIAFYIDGKLMIPFGETDSHVEEMDAVGFLVNGGVMLKF